MSIFKKKHVFPQYPKAEADESLAIGRLSAELDKNTKVMDDTFVDVGTLVKRNMVNRFCPEIRCTAYFLSSMVDNSAIDEFIIKPIICCEELSAKGELVEIIASRVIVTHENTVSAEISQLTNAILDGDTVLFIDGSRSALIITTRGWETRAIAEPDAERSLRGPKEGFTESIMTNLSMVSRKIRSADLKFKFRSFGRRTNTRACLCYLDSLVDKNILAELNRRLDAIDIDGVLDVNYINEMIRDSPYSPFKTIGTTERPDVVAGRLLEGRIALILDGTPVALTLPFLFVENFQAADDYYLSYYFASISRVLRVLGFMLTILIPGIYVAFTTIHREMIPTTLALSIMKAHQDVPFPTILESVLMLIVFEIIRETGVRMPSNVGQALSIVGALVIGQAAVEARFISAPMVIVVGVTAITGLLNQRLKGAAILLRFTVLFASSFLGIFGMTYVVIGLLIHLFSMQSFGVSYMAQTAVMRFSKMKDISIRAPWSKMKTRPDFVRANPVRKT